MSWLHKCLCTTCMQCLKRPNVRYPSNWSYSQFPTKPWPSAYPHLDWSSWDSSKVIWVLGTQQVLSENLLNAQAMCRKRNRDGRNKTKPLFWASKMAQWVRVLITKSDNLSSVPGIQVTEVEKDTTTNCPLTAMCLGRHMQQIKSVPNKPTPTLLFLQR